MPAAADTPRAILDRWTGGGPRSVARGLALGALASVYELTRRSDGLLTTPRVHILCLHDLPPDEEEGFRSMLTHLRRDHEMVAYSEAVRRAHTGDVDRPCLAVSFDDGFRSCLRAGSVLSEIGLTACFFICPSIIGERDESAIAAFCRDRLGQKPTPFLGWNEIESMRSAGHEFGSHTMTHADLGGAGPEQISDELGRSRDELVRRLGSAEHFAWPFGRMRNFQAAAARAVFEAGYTSCASAVRGCHGPRAPVARLCLRRENVSGRWPIPHVRYFLARSCQRRMIIAGDGWPDGWSVPRADGDRRA